MAVIKIDLDLDVRCYACGKPLVSHGHNDDVIRVEGCVTCEQEAFDRGVLEGREEQSEEAR